jgi:hypothetical protein
VRRRRRRRWVDQARAILQLAFAVLLLSLFLPELVRAQEHDIEVPDTAVTNPQYAETSRYYIDATYDRWWHEVAACEGIELPDYYVLVRYIQINYAYFNLQGDERAAAGSAYLGYSFVDEWQMFVAISYRYDEEVVKHEMAHFLLFWARIAKGGHPARYFNGRCGFGDRYVGHRKRTASTP